MPRTTSGETREINICISAYNHSEMQIKQTETLLRETRSSLAEVFNNHDAGSLVIGDQQFDDLIQKYFLTKTKSETYEKIVKPMISRNIYEAEGKAAGAAEIYLRLLMGYLDPKNDKFSNIKWNNLQSSLQFHAKIRPLKPEIVDLINQKCDDNITKIITNALEIAQRDDQIEVTRGYELKTSITLVSGCSFNEIKIDPAYAASKNWKKTDVNVILIDGVIEKSVHVEHILMLSHKDAVPYVIICREATDEVKNICITNFLRQTTDVILCTAPYSEKTAHIFEDLRSITDADVICPELGDVITAAIYKKAKRVNKIEIKRDSIVIENGKEEELRNQREILMKKMNEINDNDVSDLIRKRIKSLSSNRLVIKIGDDTVMKNRNAIEQIDKTLRETRDAIATGLLNVKHHMPFIKHDRDLCSTNSIRVGIETFMSFIKILNDSGLILMSQPFTF